MILRMLWPQNVELFQSHKSMRFALRIKIAKKYIERLFIDSKDC